MRFAVLSLFFFSACAADGLPIGQGSVQVADGGARDLRGTTTGGTTTGGTTTGGTTGPGTTTGGTTTGGTTTPCKTACDCPSGQACFQGGCVTSMFGKLFCCESMDCPDGQFCQSGNDGSFAQCGQSGGGTTGGTTGGTINVDLGTGGGQCQFIPCQGDRVCRRSGCNGGCDTMTGRCRP